MQRRRSRRDTCRSTLGDDASIASTLRRHGARSTVSPPRKRLSRQRTNGSDVVVTTAATLVARQPRAASFTTRRWPPATFSLDLGALHLDLLGLTLDLSEIVLDLNAVSGTGNFWATCSAPSQ